MTDQTSTDRSDEMENARAEYAATNEAYLHYDNFSWQVGSILIAGALAYWGFLLQSSPVLFVINLGNLLVCVLISIWALYASHNRQIYLFKLDRIQELEEKLNMYQHRRFKEGNSSLAEYPLSWPSGHLLDDAIYVLVSVGSLVIGWNLKYSGTWDCCNWILFLSVPLIVVLVLLRVHYVTKKTNQIIKSLHDNRRGGA